MTIKTQKYVIGIDGGGAKTDAVLANTKGKILVRAKTGPSNPNKVGMETAIFNISKAIEKVSKNKQKNKIVFIYIGLAGGLERSKKNKVRLKKELLLKQTRLLWISKKNLMIRGDQLTAFRSGTDKKEGVILISGTGSIVIGWRKGKEVVAGGWDYILGDDGSGFWLGQKALRAVCRHLDGRGLKTQLTNLIFREWNIKEMEELYKKVYTKNLVEQIASLVPLIDKAAQKRDKIAREILIESGKELALAVISVIKKLNFQKLKFPVVLVGGVLKSRIVLDRVKKEIKKVAPKVEFIRPKQEPVIGAVKLAIEQVNKK